MPLIRSISASLSSLNSSVKNTLERRRNRRLERQGHVVDVNKNEVTDSQTDDEEVQLREEITECEKEVAAKQKELCIAHLRFLSTFYVNLIEKKRYEMNLFKTMYEQNPADVEAFSDYLMAKAKICSLYEFWLRELLTMPILLDPHALCMHLMMTADCYWFLAKMNKPPIQSGVSNMEMAVRSVEKILGILCERLPTRNAFYVHILHKYALIVEEYATIHGESSNTEDSSGLPIVRAGQRTLSTQAAAVIRERDTKKLRDSIATLRRHAVRLANSLEVSREQQEESVLDCMQGMHAIFVIVNRLPQ